MMLLLINKKAVFIISVILPVVLSNYAMAGCDLEMYSIRILEYRNPYLPGSTIIGVRGSVRNVGDERSEDFRFVYYLGDYYLDTVYLSVHLGPGDSDTSNYKNLTVPSNITPGEYPLRAVVYCSNDSNSTNNACAYTQNIKIKAPPPVIDLQITALDAISPWGVNLVNPGQEIKFGCSIINKGDTASESYSVYFSIASTSISKSYAFGPITCDPLGPGETCNISETESFLIPSNAIVGTYTVRSSVSCSNETVTNNNSTNSATKLRIANPYQDIAIKNVLFAGSNVKPGDTINITTIIQNIGTYKAENIYLELYIGEYLLNSTYRSDLYPEHEDAFTIECHIPDNLPDDYYTIKAIVNCTDDSDNSNNYGNSDFFRIGKNPDLEVKSILATKGIYTPKDIINIYNLIENVGDDTSNPYTIDFYMSPDKNISAMDYRIGRIERKGLEPGSQHSYNTTFKLPPNLPVGNYYVGVRVICNEEENFGNNSGYDNETVGIIHPANYVCGHITYEYTGQNNQAVRFALLKIIDAGTDRVIAQTYTDENGNYGEVVLRDEMSPGNVYVKVYAESVIGAYPGTRSKICSVRSDADKHLYSRQSPNYSHTQNSSRIIDYTIPISGRAIMVFDSMVEAFINAKEYFGIEMEPITTYWPSNNKGTYYYPGEGIFIGIDDEWDRDVILHEYGHYIAEVYGFCQGNVGENPNHAWDVDLREFPVQRTAEHAANLAFRESWPTLFSIASQYYNSLYPRSGDTKYHDYYSYYNWSYELDLEEDTFDKGSTGEFYENMNCCALWDIFDNHPDNISFSEEISDPNLSKTWSVIRGYKPEDMNDFWVGWFHHFGQNEDKDGIIDILQEHRMSFAQSGIVPQVPKNHAPVANAGQDKTVAQDRTEGALVHLSASGSSDSDGDALSYVWRYGYISYSGEQVDIVLPAGRNEIELEVSDGKITTWDTIVVTVTPTNPGT